MHYQRIYKSPTNNHLFVNTSMSQATYICDNSGSDPEYTDDGPLRFAHKSCDKIVVKPSRLGGVLEANVPVVVERQQNEPSGYSAFVDLNGAIMLGQRHNIDVVMENVLHRATGHIS